MTDTGREKQGKRHKGKQRAEKEKDRAKEGQRNIGTEKERKRCRDRDIWASKWFQLQATLC